MLEAKAIPYNLKFLRPARTSRAVMTEKETYFIKVWDSELPEVSGIGEAAVFRGLSADDTPDYVDRLNYYCKRIASLDRDEIQESSIRFGIETAISDLKNGGNHAPFCPGIFKPIKINGLIWMGSAEDMADAAEKKISDGFNCIKLKIGGIDFDKEVAILKAIRERCSPDRLEIRLDANGAFPHQDALKKLDILSGFHIHSIEQPIRSGQIAQMAEICRQSPIPIALDEELIGINSYARKCEILDTVRPAYIILKPSLCGGFAEADDWITAAENYGIGWWATSALESNIGLNAIARWLDNKKIFMPQGLGTGMLYSNNISSPLTLRGEYLQFEPSQSWDLTNLKF